MTTRKRTLVGDANPPIEAPPEEPGDENEDVPTAAEDTTPVTPDPPSDDPVTCPVNDPVDHPERFPGDVPPDTRHFQIFCAAVTGMLARGNASPEGLANRAAEYADAGIERLDHPPEDIDDEYL